MAGRPGRREARALATMAIEARKHEDLGDGAKKRVPWDTPRQQSVRSIYALLVILNARSSPSPELQARARATLEVLHRESLDIEELLKTLPQIAPTARDADLVRAARAIGLPEPSIAGQDDVGLLAPPGLQRRLAVAQRGQIARVAARKVAIERHAQSAMGKAAAAAEIKKLEGGG